LVRGVYGTGACNVSMTQAQFVTANFTASYALTVSKSGTGAGTVTAIPQESLAEAVAVLATFPAPR